MFLRLEPGSWMVVRVVDLIQSDEVVEVSVKHGVLPCSSRTVGLKAEV